MPLLFSASRLLTASLLYSAARRPAIREQIRVTNTHTGVIRPEGTHYAIVGIPIVSG